MQTECGNSELVYIIISLRITGFRHEVHEDFTHPIIYNMRCLYRTGNLFNNAINAIVRILLLLQGREASDILQARDRNCRLRIPSERVRRWPTIVIKCMSDSEYSFLQIRNQSPSIFSLLIPKFQRKGWSQSFLILITQIKQR